MEGRSHSKKADSNYHGRMAVWTPKPEPDGTDFCFTLPELLCL